MIRTAILGATGYAGAELVKLISGHRHAECTFLASRTYQGLPISQVFGRLSGVCDIPLEAIDMDLIKDRCDVCFLALPHSVSMDIAYELYQRGVIVIDLSADYRYNHAHVYNQWYHLTHAHPELLTHSVYGLCELYEEQIASSRLIGNPGCYPTCSILALYPLLKNHLVSPDNIIIDAKSGVSGAGRTASLDFSYCECQENAKAYKVATHRHTSEIEQELSLAYNPKADHENTTLIPVSFTPHLLPLRRGMLSTCYANLTQDISREQLLDMYRNFYEKHYFVRICENMPEIKNVAYTNFVDISLQVDERLNRVIVCSALDNMLKGASGQAVQNMNIIFGFNQNEGLVS